MKKAIIFSMVLTAFAVVSCKKDYICGCTTTTTSGSGTVTGSGDTTFTDITKSDAETKCNSFESSGSFGGYSWDTDCELK